MATKVYFYQNDSCIRYGSGANRAELGYPRPIPGNWPGVAEAGFENGFDAVVNWGNGKAYLFLGRNYLRYDIGADKVDPGYPRPIAGNWPGMAEAGFGDKVDAAIDL